MIAKTGNFKRLRTQAGLNIMEAAALIEVSRTTAYFYERGERPLRGPALKLLKQAALSRKQTEADNAAASGKPWFTFIDLFAGIGGLRLGFEGIGGKCVFTSEWDKYSQKTYEKNFQSNHEVSGDIRVFAENPSRIKKHDLLLAGFPCQPFSIAGVSKKNALGRAHGFLCDTQGTLFFDTARIIAHHRPAAFVLENVKNLVSHDSGRTFATILNVLQNELRYHVQTRVLSSAPWVPQNRERIFIVGFREPTEFDLSSLQLPPENKGPKLGSILETDVDPKYTLTAHLWKYLQDYKAKHTAKGNGFGYSLFGPNDVTRTLSQRYYKDGSEILVEQKGNRPRRLTPRECARLMGFETAERKWVIPVSDTQAYRQFGNAVVVPVVQFIAEAMREHLRAAVFVRPKAKPQSNRRVA